MTSKVAEQLVDVVHQARIISDALPITSDLQTEPTVKHERAIRFYIQSCQIDRLSAAITEYRTQPDFNPEVLDNCLYYASFYGFPSAVKTLLENGASPHYKTPSGYTTLMKAVGSRNAETVQLLLGARADLDATTSTGMTAQKVAETVNEPEILETLRNRRGS